MSVDKFTVMETSDEEIFLGIMGIGFSILFCTAFCRVCQRFRDDRLEREEWLRAREAGRPTSVFVIPVHGGGPSRLERDDYPDRGPPRYSQEVLRPPRYSVTVGSGPPPAYNELGFKPEDLVPGYTEHSLVPSYSMSPPPTSPNMGPNQTEVLTPANVGGKCGCLQKQKTRHAKYSQMAGGVTRELLEVADPELKLRSEVWLVKPNGGSADPWGCTGVAHHHIRQAALLGLMVGESPGHRGVVYLHG
ncbi:unnamed protein product [Lota lota]